MKNFLDLKLWLAIAGCLSLKAAERPSGPWNLDAPKAAPKVTWGARTGLVQQVWYEGEPFQGKPTRVFAYYSRPAEGQAPFPAMVLVHGGGGKAFAEWATLWAERGYAALAMDLSGRGPDGQRLPDGGPEQDDVGKFRNFAGTEAREMWTYHAVAAALRGHSLLAAQKEVDPSRIGITGISWGGYLTCIVAGLDDRLKVAVPVYGCGFIHESSVWVDSRFAKMKPEQRERWAQYFDPSQYLPGVRCPILFVNGTTDFAYPLDSYQKSYRLVPAGADLCVQVGLKHGHKEGWSIPEIGLYVDSVLKGGTPLPKVGRMETWEGNARLTFRSQTPVTKAQLHYTTDSGPWPKRTWESLGAFVIGTTAQAPLPSERPLVCFMTVTDGRGAVVSTEHVVLER